MEFKEFKIPKMLLKGLTESGFTSCTPIQDKVLPIAFSGKDIVGIAQTGSGKTLGFLIPLLRDLKFSDDRYPRIVILVPTRELVAQIVEVLEEITKYMSVRILAVYGGKNMNPQKQMVHDGCDIIVATPGRLYDLAMTGILRFKAVKKLVLDEYDEMLELGFRPQIERILELLPKKRQNMLFSATYNDNVESVASVFLNHPEVISVDEKIKTTQTVDHFAYPVPNFYTKLNFLKSVLTKESPEKVFIFVKSRKIADLLHEKISVEFKNFGVVHSNKSQNYRLRMMEEIESGDISGLIATDVIARGIDIDDVSHVINFDLPETVDQFIHRIGRTGRMGKMGKTISFINEEDISVFDEIMESERVKINIEELPAYISVSDEKIPQEESRNPFEGPSVK
jgi:ATP-dependent RNA helicase RhlE